MMKIWQRYFIKEIVTTALFILMTFYALYILIDYTNHSASFHQHQSRLKGVDFIFYYAAEFILRSEVLIPFALLIATIKTVCHLNSKNELIALLAAGIPMRTLLRPFCIFALAATFFMYINNQFLFPIASKERQQYEERRARHKDTSTKNSAQQLTLPDKSTLIFKRYDPINKRFIDAYWLPSTAEIWRLKSISAADKPAIGYGVEEVRRQANGERKVVARYKERPFPEISFDSDLLKSGYTPPEGLSLAELWKVQPVAPPKSEKIARLVATFQRRLATPWLCFLAVISPIPFCIRFSRHFSVFIIYALGVFGLAAIYIVIDAVHLLARRQILEPQWAIWLPITSLISLFVYRYAKIK